jgi:hypothetical protein
MIYSFIVLAFGIFLGQEYNLPLVKDSVLYIYNLLNDRKKTVNEINKNIFSFDIYRYFQSK